jgi:hypothetical protein
MVSLHPDCSNLRNQSNTRIGWQIVVIFGTIVANVPQQYRIAKRRSAEGISAYFLLTGVVSATCGLTNIAGLSLDTFRCYKNGDITKGQCTTGILGVVLIAVQWLVMFVM